MTYPKLNPSIGPRSFILWVWGLTWFYCSVLPASLCFLSFTELNTTHPLPVWGPSAQFAFPIFQDIVTFPHQSLPFLPHLFPQGSFCFHVSLSSKFIMFLSASVFMMPTWPCKKWIMLRKSWGHSFLNMRSRNWSYSALSSSLNGTVIKAPWEDRFRDC